MTDWLTDWLIHWLIDYLMNWVSILSISSVGHFFHIGSSKSVPKRRCFAHFELHMCFAPKRRAIFICETFKKWPEPVSFSAFWLANVLRATAAYHFVHFDSKMHFGTQRRANVQHLNFKNWPVTAVFCTFWLENALCATAACHFSFLYWTATSAHAALASLLFEHPEPRIIEKT